MGSVETGAFFDFPAIVGVRFFVAGDAEDRTDFFRVAGMVIFYRRVLAEERYCCSLILHVEGVYNLTYRDGISGDER